MISFTLISLTLLSILQNFNVTRMHSSMFVPPACCPYLPACSAGGGVTCSGGVYLPRYSPLWTDRHVKKHNLRKLRLRTVKITEMSYWEKPSCSLKPTVYWFFLDFTHTCRFACRWWFWWRRFTRRRWRESRHTAQPQTRPLIRWRR